MPRDYTVNTIKFFLEFTRPYMGCSCLPFPAGLTYLLAPSLPFRHMASSLLLQPLQLVPVSGSLPCVTTDWNALLHPQRASLSHRSPIKRVLLFLDHLDLVFSTGSSSRLLPISWTPLLSIPHSTYWFHEMTPSV